MAGRFPSSRPPTAALGLSAHPNYRLVVVPDLALDPGRGHSDVFLRVKPDRLGDLAIVTVDGCAPI